MKKYIWLTLLLLVACGKTAVSPPSLPEPSTTQIAQPTAMIEPTPTELEAAIWPLYDFAKHGVTVTVFLHRNDVGDYQLTADFVPDEPSMHLYGMRLPIEGIQGVGRPTLLDVVSNELIVNGDLAANVDAIDHEFPTFTEPFPLYPDGPVTLTLPVSIAENADLSAVELSITYMACSSKGVCKPPVTDHRFVVELPANTN